MVLDARFSRIVRGVYRKWDYEPTYCWGIGFTTRRPLGTNVGDPFRELGITKSASPAEAKTAYYNLIKKYHPDKDPNNSEKFKRLQAAYKQVKEFHSTGVYGGANGSGPRSSGSSNVRSGNTRYSYQYTQQTPGQKSNNNYDFDPNRYNTWSSTSSRFKDAEDYIWFVKKTFETEKFKQSEPFANSSGWKTTYSTNNTKKDNVFVNEIHKVTITFLESCIGTVKKIQARTCLECNGMGTKGYNEVICLKCDGRGNLRVSQGMINIVIPCPACNRYGVIKNPIICSKCEGQGSFIIPKQYQVTIPPGVKDGEFIDVVCGGYTHKLHIKVTPSNVFVRKDDEIHSHAEIDYIQALMGDTIIVPTVHGDATVQIPPGTSSHSSLRVPGKGISGGPHFVHIKIRVPHDPGSKCKNLVSQLAKERGFSLSSTIKNGIGRSSLVPNFYSLNYIKDKIIIYLEGLGINVNIFTKIYELLFKR